MTNLRRCFRLHGALFSLAVIGCQSAQDAAWKDAYNANRTAAYREAAHEAAISGQKAGEERGRADAERDAATGHAWQLYSTPALLALAVGMGLGLSIQYIILACCKHERCLPEIWAEPFLPALRYSTAYSIMERRRRLIVECEQEMDRLAADATLRVAQIRAVHAVIRQKVIALSTLEELTQARVMQLAKDEITKVVSRSEQEASRTLVDPVALPNAAARFQLECPNCGQLIGYNRKHLGTTINCPYRACALPVRIPMQHSAEANIA
jgi:hypothetical protein